MKHALAAILLGLPLLGLVTNQPAQACACCAQPHTLNEYQASSSQLLAPGVKLNGNLLAVSDLSYSVDALIDPGRLQTSGTIGKGLIKLAVARGGKQLGTLTLRFQGEASHRLTGLDFILSKADLAKLEMGPEPPLYHEIIQPVKIDASPELRKALGLSFGSSATLTFHGIGNACWNPHEAAANWTLSYAMLKGKLLQNGMARGSSAPPQ